MAVDGAKEAQAEGGRGGGIHVVAGRILFVWYVRRVSEALFLYATIKVLIPTIIFWIAERTADRKICGQKK